MAIEKYEYELRSLSEEIKALVSASGKKIVKAINNEMVLIYWQIGKLIVQTEQNARADEQSTRNLIIDLSKELSSHLGRGYSRSNLTYMRLFYIGYPAGVTASHQLSWSHYIELLKVEGSLERSFYENQSVAERWSVRELRRQKDSALFQRLSLSKDKDGILKLSQKGQLYEREEDIIKDPYVLEFLNLPEETRFSEKQLENRILAKLQQFLLELGKGFAFVANQYRITLNNTHFYVDMAFYHRILKCFVLFDLKIREARQHDVGQMNMYLNYFKEEENVKDDNPPIGIILTTGKDEVMIEYATGGLSNKVFVSRYQTHLPDKDLLRARVSELMRSSEQ